MAWTVSTDNVTDIDTLLDWDALIQAGQVIDLPGTVNDGYVVLADSYEVEPRARLGASMIAGEQKVLRWYPNDQPPLPAPVPPLSLIGGTVTIKILTPTSVLLTYTMALTTDVANPVGDYGYYRTLDTDTPVGGVYWIDVIARFADGYQRKKIYKWFVASAL